MHSSKPPQDAAQAWSTSELGAARHRLPAGKQKEETSAPPRATPLTRGLRARLHPAGVVPASSPTLLCVCPPPLASAPRRGALHRGERRRGRVPVRGRPRWPSSSPPAGGAAPALAAPAVPRGVPPVGGPEAGKEEPHQVHHPPKGVGQDGEPVGGARGDDGPARDVGHDPGVMMEGARNKSIQHAAARV